MITIIKHQKQSIFFLLATALIIMFQFCATATASNDGLIGANIQDGQLIGYFGEGGDIVIPNTVTVIAAEAFKDNDNVTSVTIPGSVQVIGYNAFEGCTELERVIFSDPVDGANLTIRVSAFINCPKLYDIELPATAVYVTANIFKGCTSLEAIKVHKENPYYFTDEYGVLFGPWVNEGEPQYEDENLSLIAYPCGRVAGGYTIPQKVGGHPVNRVWASGFRTAKNLTSIEIPSNITILGANAFEQTGLQNVVIPDTVTTLGESLFEGCEDLTDVTLPANMTQIPLGFFMGCTNLVRINMPDTITSFEMYSFKDCKSLTTLITPKKLTTIAVAAFEGCNNLQRAIISPSVINFPSDEYLGAYDPFDDSPRSLVVYVEKGSAGEKWAFNNIEDWGYSYVVLDDVYATESIDAGSFYLIDMAKKIKVEGAFPITATLDVTPVKNGTEYNAFAAEAGSGSLQVYQLALMPSSTTISESLTLSFGLPTSFTTKSQLYGYSNGAVQQMSANMVSKTLTTEADSLGYFAIIDKTTEGGGDDDGATAVNLNKTTATIEVGKNLQLSATIQPSTVADKSITWASSNNGIATVTSKGVVTAHQVGNVDITATASNGVKGACKLTVTSSSALDPDSIASKASLHADRTAGNQGEASFSLSLSEASRISTVQITFETSSDQVNITGKNGFTMLGDSKGKMQNGVYTGTAVLSYLTSDQSLFSTTESKAVAQILVDAEKPSLKITDMKIAGWGTDKVVAYGTVNELSPAEAKFNGAVNYDVTGDGAVDLKDIAKAQQYYRVDSANANWSEASTCDFNGDNLVSIDDFIEIWLNFTN